ncbi:hypothetical protein [Listeria costaricensis]|uniref:hypothetical protein n=1 Tax=Listeria costaricensis TaxID=2026604 RepID=UPI000C069B3B|nr:hypothetical protein [Listeria costaricensis]
MNELFVLAASLPNWDSAEKWVIDAVIAIAWVITASFCIKEFATLKVKKVVMIFLIGGIITWAIKYPSVWMGWIEAFMGLFK